MRTPHAGAPPSHSRRTEIIYKPSQAGAIAHGSTDRLHLALAVALVIVSLVALAFPVTRSHITDSGTGTPTVATVTEGVTATVQNQAQTVVSAITQAAVPTATPEVSAVPARGVDGFPAGNLVPRPLLVTAAQVLVQGALAAPEGQPGLVMALQEPVSFTLHEKGLPSQVYSTRPTVGTALAALGADVSRHDIVSPSPDTPLTPGLHVFVERAITVTLSVGGERPAEVHTHAETVADLLAEQGVELSEHDSVTPRPSFRLRDGAHVAVTLVNHDVEVEEYALPFATYYYEDPELPQGQEVLARAGAEGWVHREYAVVYRNGEEVSRELVAEKIVLPTDELIAVGTAVVVEPEPEPPPAVVSGPLAALPCAHTMTVWATWYTAASAGGSGITATGTAVYKGIIAVDPSVIPLGTRMYVPGYGYGVAADTGGAIIGNMIDLGYGPDDVKDWGNGWVEICILN